MGGGGGEGRWGGGGVQISESASFPAVKTRVILNCRFRLKGQRRPEKDYV